MQKQSLASAEVILKFLAPLPCKMSSASRCLRVVSNVLPLMFPAIFQLNSNLGIN